MNQTIIAKCLHEGCDALVDTGMAVYGGTSFDFFDAYCPAHRQKAIDSAMQASNEDDNMRLYSSSLIHP